MAKSKKPKKVDLTPELPLIENYLKSIEGKRILLNKIDKESMPLLYNYVFKTGGSSVAIEKVEKETKSLKSKPTKKAK